MANGTPILDGMLEQSYVRRRAALSFARWPEIRLRLLPPRPCEYGPQPGPRVFLLHFKASVFVLEKGAVRYGVHSHRRCAISRRGPRGVGGDLPVPLMRFQTSRSFAPGQLRIGSTDRRAERDGAEA